MLVLPHVGRLMDEQAERAVIGSMLIDADCVKDVLNAVEADDFYINTNQEVFTAIRRMHVAAKPIDGVTVASELEREGLYSSETRNYLLQCMEITPSPVSRPPASRRVVDCRLPPTSSR